jgi:hypothetical protein
MAHIRISSSVVSGILLSLLIGGETLIGEQHLWYDSIFLMVVPAAAFAFLFWLSYPHVASTSSRLMLTGVLLAVPPTFLHINLLNRSYPNSAHIMALTVIGLVGYGAFFHHGRNVIMRGVRRILANPINLLIAGTLALFPAGALAVALRYPIMFRPEEFLLPAEYLPAVAAGMLLTVWAAGPFFTWLEKAGVAEQLKRRGMREFLETNLPGIFAFFIFLIGYFIIARGFNPPIEQYSLDNSFFAADSLRWLRRFGTQESYGIWRAVHPLAIPLLRVPAWILSLSLNGDWHTAALLLIALTGAGCVFFMWRLLLGATGNETAALAFAGILGVSTSHLIFSSVTETYIFSAFGLLLLFTLIQPSEQTLQKMIPAGILTLGITVSNFAQGLIAFLLIRRNGREWLTFVSITLAAGVALTLLTNMIYPRWNTFFFSPTDLLFETKHTGHFQVNTTKRAVQLSKDLFLHNIAAPKPMHKIEEEDNRLPFPRFNFAYFHPTLVEYRQHRYGPPAIGLWTILLVGAFASFLIQNKKSPHLKVQLTAIVLFGFNFLLHLDYGFEPFLYTPNWTYLTVIFVALSLAYTFRYKAMQFLLFASLLALTINNIVFLRILADIIQPLFP